MSSPTNRLLDELSWEGNARKYRGGGHRLENVLTTEVFGHLDLLPRTWFLARVLQAAQGADDARVRVAGQAEELAVEVLPGDLIAHGSDGQPTGWKVQPDVLLDGADSFTYVEAKAATGGTFGGQQLARTLMAALDAAADRTPLVLLVTGSAPPWPVQGHGRLALDAAVEAGLDSLPEVEQNRLRGAVTEVVSWITWRQIADAVEAACDEPWDVDPSVRSATLRTAHRITGAIDAAYEV